MKLRYLQTFLFSLLMLFAIGANASGWEQHRDTIANAAQYSPFTVGEMAALAHIESSFNPRAKNGYGSSAAGLFAVTKDTWRAGVKEHGYKYGITMRTSRYDPDANALITAELLTDSEQYLTKRLKRQPTSGEIFMAHLLGQGGASKLIRAKGSRRACDVLPIAARGNPSFFYTKSGKARTVRQMRDYTNWYFSKLASRYQATESRGEYNFALAKL